MPRHRTHIEGSATDKFPCPYPDCSNEFSTIGTDVVVTMSTRRFPCAHIVGALSRSQRTSSWWAQRSLRRRPNSGGPLLEEL